MVSDVVIVVVVVDVAVVVVVVVCDRSCLTLLIFFAENQLRAKTPDAAQTDHHDFFTIKLK